MPKKILKNLTLYSRVNEVLTYWTCEMQKVLNQNLIGLYLFESLFYEDFIYKRSDIDLGSSERTTHIS
jgi:hypothetical protein